jgi:hypothetical protein
MKYRSICLLLWAALQGAQAGAADGLQAPTADAVWPQWQVRMGLQTGPLSPLSMRTAFGGIRLGLGQASAAWQNGVALTADLGLVGEGLGTGQRSALFGDEGVARLPREPRLSPLLQLGVRYTF